MSNSLLCHTTKPLRRRVLTEEGQRKSPKNIKCTIQTGKEPYKNHSEKNGALQNAKKSKTTKMKFSQKKAQLKALTSSTQRTQSSGIFVKQVVFLTVNHRWPLPLRELHSTVETIVWRDRGGSWACLPPVYDYEWNHPTTCCHICRTCPKKQLRKKKSHKTLKRS